MVAEHIRACSIGNGCCSLAKISMVAELVLQILNFILGCSLAKISMVAELWICTTNRLYCCSLAKISMVAELIK